MKQIGILLFLCSYLCAWGAVDENIMGWKTYLSYRNTTQVEESAEQVYVVAQGALYTYGKEDNSIRTYQKGTDLSDSDIQHIAYNKQTKSLLIVYSNSNIDILDDESVTNLPYLSTNTTLKSKGVNEIMMQGEYAYLSTEFGVIVVNMAKREIADTYNLSINVTSCAILDKKIYISTVDAEAGSNLFTASLTDNLLDKANWKVFAPKGLADIGTVKTLCAHNGQLFYFILDKGAYYISEGNIKTLLNHSKMNKMQKAGDKLVCITASYSLYIYGNKLDAYDRITDVLVSDISTYQTDRYWLAEGANGLCAVKRLNTGKFETQMENLILDGPYTNSPYKVFCNNDKVYLIAGGKRLTNGQRLGNAGVLMVYDYNKWSSLLASQVRSKCNISPRDYTSLAIRTNQIGDEEIFMTSFGDGLVRVKNMEPVVVYDEKNSPIANAAGLSSKYCYVDGLAFDKAGNLWMTNSETDCAIRILDTEDKWHNLYVPSLKGKYTINDILITSDNNKWINIPRPTDQVSLTVIADSPSLDSAESHEFKSFVDTDGNNFSPSNYTCMAEDRNGYVWVGTNRGVIYFTNPRLAATDQYQSMRCNRVKLTDEEDNPYYFLDNVLVTAIKIDPGNRKWIGTEGNGLYLLSANNQDIVHQFTTNNSPLLSNTIYSIDINPSTGEVFIGTDKGLVSYQGEATVGREDYSEVYAYPNPVRPTDRDQVTIAGLMDNSIVKITDLNGHLIYQTCSLGGQVTWNCRNAKGTRVASGIYLVLSATEDSKESVVTKIAVIK